ncbi:MAG: carbon-nitrogen hydrolase family protein [Cyclobacteriaceae bacterium]
MKIAAAQTRPIKGDVLANITDHLELIDLAIAQDVNLIYFPELSLTGYEPALAHELATSIGDPRLGVFQKAADQHGITINLGLPILGKEGILIGSLTFQPKKSVMLYCKRFLHQDEQAYFVPGSDQANLIQRNVAMAICYEISITEHANDALKSGVGCFLASVAKTSEGSKVAHQRLSELARKNNWFTMMANSVGHCAEGELAGQSAAWKSNGELIGQLNKKDGGVLIVDSDIYGVQSFYI